MATRVHSVTKEVPVEKAGTDGEHAPLLTRAQILSVEDIASRVVAVPEWGGSVRVRGLTGRGRDLLEARFTDARGQLDIERSGGFRAGFVAQAVIDEDGRLLFTDDDVKALGEKSSVALQRVFDAASSLSAINQSDMDGILVDLKADPNGGTGSD